MAITYSMPLRLLFFTRPILSSVSKCALAIAAVGWADYNPRAPSSPGEGSLHERTPARRMRKDGCSGKPILLECGISWNSEQKRHSIMCAPTTDSQGFTRLALVSSCLAGDRGYRFWPWRRAVGGGWNRDELAALHVVAQAPPNDFV
jgi:hypothetical protein